MEETKERKQREREENERFKRKGERDGAKNCIGKGNEKEGKERLQKMEMSANKNALWKAGRRE